jgi:predicted ArsR family transcriptional regulator
VRRKNAPLGRRQQLVLMLLAGQPKSVEDMAYDHMPGLDEPAIRSAIEGLERRSLIDVHTREPGRSGRLVRVYCLTARGAAAERAIHFDPDDDA